jgi:hypothetical protein|tara:strand:- start:471 stop:1304 length:834 start_codon:yes stop_codon:yes gene_type:complete
MGARRKSPDVRSSRPPRRRKRFNPTRTINRRRPEPRGGGQVSIDDGSFLKTFSSPVPKKLQEEMAKSGVKQVGKTIKKGGGQVSIDDGPMLGRQEGGGARRAERRRRRGRRRMAGGRNIRSITRRAPQREGGGQVTIDDGSMLRRGDAPGFRRRPTRGGAGGGQVSIDDGPMLRGRNPESGVRYKQDGTPTAVQQTERVDVQDPTLGGRPEREVPNDRGIARDRLRRRVRERREANRQERSMRREEQSNIKSALASERGIRASERDFTRRRSAMEGG